MEINNTVNDISCLLPYDDSRTVPNRIDCGTVLYKSVRDDHVSIFWHSTVYPAELLIYKTLLVIFFLSNVSLIV